MKEPELATLLPKLGGNPQLLEAAARTRKETGKWPEEGGAKLLEEWVRRAWESLSEGARLVLAMAVMIDQPLPLELLRQKWDRKFNKGMSEKLRSLTMTQWRLIKDLKLEKAAEVLMETTLVELEEDALQVPPGIAAVLRPLVLEPGEPLATASVLLGIWMQRSPNSRSWRPLAKWYAEWWIPRIQEPAIDGLSSPVEIFKSLSYPLIKNNDASSRILRTWLSLPEVNSTPPHAHMMTLALAEVLHREGNLEEAISALVHLQDESSLDDFARSFLFSHLGLLYYLVGRSQKDLNLDLIFDHLRQAIEPTFNLYSKRRQLYHTARTTLNIRYGHVLLGTGVAAGFLRFAGNYKPTKTVHVVLRAEHHRLLGLAQLHLAEHPETSPKNGEAPLPSPAELLNQAEENLRAALKLLPEEDYPEEARSILEGIGKIRRLRLTATPKAPAASGGTGPT